MSAVEMQVRQTAEARRQEAGLKAVLDEKRRLFDTEHEALIQQHRLAVARRETAEDALRHLALEVVRTTGETKPGPGVACRSVIRVELQDEGAALEWAKRTGFCLQLDRKALEAIGKHHDLPFLRVSTDQQITLAKDLDAALAAAERPAPAGEAVTP